MLIHFDFKKIPERINTSFYPLIDNKDRYLVLWGGAGSGKSHFIAQKFILRILGGMALNKKHKILALRKTQPAVRKSVFALFCKYINDWKLNDLVHINKTDMTFEWINGSEIMCCGLDDREKLKSIEGITSAWLEEATEFEADDFKQVDLRVRGQTDSYKQICVSFNPVSKQKWVYDYLFKRKQENITRHHSTHKDNRFLDDDYRQVLEDLKDEDRVYYQIYAIGEWGVIKGVIYNNWDLVDEFPSNCDEILYGIDFGFNKQSAVIKIGIKDQKDCYIKEELYETRLTNTDLISRLETIVPSKSLLLKADSAEPDRIEEINRAGFYIMPARKGKNSVKDGIDVVKRKRLHVVRDSTNVIDELQGYKWKEDKDGNTLDEPVKFRDHACDAIRYALGDMEDSEVRVWDL